MRGFDEDFREAANLASDNVLRSGTWSVFAEYSKGDTEQADGFYIFAPPKLVEKDEDGKLQFLDNERWDYQPMVRYPDLFLRFARLLDDTEDAHNTDTNTATALSWAYDYGVLGLTPSRMPGALWGEDDSTWWGEVHGGKGDSVSAFIFQARLAKNTLRLYELATAPQEVDVEAIKQLMPYRERRTYGWQPHTLRDWALGAVATIVQEQVARHAYPDLYRTPQGTFVRAWSFHNLLGAMWLQMYFLLTNGEPTRCSNYECNKVITFEGSMPASNPGLRKNARGRYKTRSDKRFCSKACANRYRYLTKTKPQRQAARTV